MKWLDLTLDTPAGNLACDEALLNLAETGGSEVLRSWEPRGYFVVVGYANKVETEVNVAACRKKNVPIFRRCSGGGTVLQGPGCLITRSSCKSATTLLSRTFPARTDLSWNKIAVRSNWQLAIGHRQSPFAAIPTWPLLLAARLPRRRQVKPVTRHIAEIFRQFPATAQERPALHGTFLLNFDLALVNELLRMPSKQPAYRNQRSHDTFLTNLNLSAGAVKTALQKIWHADSPMANLPMEEISRLAREKYSTFGLESQIPGNEIARGRRPQYRQFGEERCDRTAETTWREFASKIEPPFAANFFIANDDRFCPHPIYAS